jgi:hypothetical protein
VDKPHPHRDTRLVRKLDSGNYLVCHEGMGMVREYDPAGRVVWEYEVPLFGQEPRPGHGPEGFGNAVFAALRLANGNTLISTGNGHSILEVSPAKKIVWSLKQDDLPGIRLGWVTTLQVLPTGNIVFGNCHAGPDNPQIIEITRDKKVAWTFRDFTRFGSATSNSQVLAPVPDRPLDLHPANPHYFRFRGKPTVLITSGEHYGAVLNREFDQIRYLKELQRCGFNLTRTFSGTYVEVPGSFGIVDNTLAPAAKAYLSPWARSNQAGAADGGDKFDLTRWNEDYFTRLRDFVTQAGQRAIVIEMVLFCPLYDDKLWNVSPMRAANNVNGIGKVGRTEVFALKEKALTEVQEAVALKIVTELKDFDNVYFEVCNEPYFGGVTPAWQDRIIEVIVDAEKGLKHRHLIAQNIANGSARIEKPNPHVSVFNFHYATPPTAVGLNYSLKRPLGDDETGFKGTGDRAYRTEAWDFVLAGGAIFSNLDYSFTYKNPDGTFQVTTSPGGGGAELRRQLSILKRFIEGFDFIKMQPDDGALRKKQITPAPAPKGEKPEPMPTVRVLAERGRQYAVYVRGGVAAELTLELPEGDYQTEWLNPRTGKVDQAEKFRHTGGGRTLQAPAYAEDIALRLIRDLGN